ncbi:MAG: hypothetical protein NPIRA01_01850 [Nitrospirales bacterium]|nr:MAG: hypothetical protein NPIRA01_01850 [Nitrospirales bacterium]
MIAVDILIALSITLILTVFFSLVLGRRGPWASFPLFFLVLFLLTWAGGAWVMPIGPTIGGAYWMPFFIVGLIFAILLIAAAPPPPALRTRPNTSMTDDQEIGAIVVVETFFWIMVIGLITIIALRYIF